MFPIRYAPPPSSNLLRPQSYRTAEAKRAGVSPADMKLFRLGSHRELDPNYIQTRFQIHLEPIYTLSFQYLDNIQIEPNHTNVYKMLPSVEHQV